MFGAVLIYRLVGLQIEDHKRYLEEASALDKVPFKPIPANRGRIFARGPGGKGTVELVANEPCFEVAVYYPVMDPDELWLISQHHRLRKKLQAEAKNPKLEISREESTLRLRQELDQFWKTLSQNTNLASDELFDRRDRIVQAIQNRLQAIHKTQRENDLYADDPVLDQRMYYPLITDLDETEALNIRGKLPANSWAVVRPSLRRVYRKTNLMSPPRPDRTNSRQPRQNHLQTQAGRNCPMR